MQARNVISLVAVLIVLSAGALARGDAIARLQPDKLEAFRQALKALRGEWRKLERPGPFTEYRANLHVHSKLSHDSRGTIEEIVAAAKTVGTRVLLFTEHPAPHYDVFKDGHKGVRDGVLLIPGAETKGFLVFPKASLRGLDAGTPQEFADVVRRQDGLAFLSHLEERMDWEIRGLTGVEIYNTHADFKDEKKLIAAMRNPLWLLQTAEVFRKYPQEAFSALLDYPADYLRRWDQLCAKTPHSGIAANDAHQNVGLAVRLLDGGKARLEDALGKKLFEADVALIPPLAALAKDKKAGDTLFELRLDPYENSLRHVGTHLLLTELSEKAVWEALTAGRAFVAFDWLADATGFDFAVAADRRHEMGSRLAFSSTLTLRAQAPLPVRWKVVRNGKVISESKGRTLEVAAPEPGNYRVEAWLHVAGEDVIWILSNPVYIRASKTGSRSP
jgi:PHP domain